MVALSIEGDLMPNLLPELTSESRAALEAAAKHPEWVWDLQVKYMPELMEKVDLMLAGGVTPEWIIQRGQFFSMPIEVQTAFLNALHWRQQYLRRPRV